MLIKSGDELFHTYAVEINRGPLTVGFRHDSISVLVVLDALPFGKNLHNYLLYFWSLREHMLREGVRSRRGRDGPKFVRLEAGNVLRLQALWTFAYLKFNCLPFYFKGHRQQSSPAQA